MWEVAVSVESDGSEYPHFFQTAGLDEIRRLARQFAEKEIRPVMSVFDESQDFPLELVGKLGEIGFMGLMSPEHLGGAGLSDIEAITVIEEIARVDPSVALTVASHNSLCTGHINLFGNVEQKQRYVPNLAAGRTLGAWALTESGSGSDSAGMKTSACRDENGWLLNGSKTFITQGSVGSLYVVFAVTDPGKGKGGISAFILERPTPGFSVGKRENKLGMRSSDTAALTFENVRIPPENIIGREGEGFRQALAVLDGGRIGIAALSVGIAQGALDASLSYARERRQFGHSISSYQAIQWKLADIATEVSAARLMARRAAWLKMAGEPFTEAASQAKYFASEAAVRAANEAVQIHGGYGFIKDYPVEKFYRDVKLMTIGEGTSEVQKIIIARHLLSLHRD